jgi:hypothetical protein
MRKEGATLLYRFAAFDVDWLHLSQSKNWMYDVLKNKETTFLCI